MQKRELPHKKQIAVIVGILLVFLIICGIFLATRTKPETQGYLDGYIITEGEQSATVPHLFYRNGDRYMVGLQKLDELLDLDVIRTDAGYVIRTTKHQIEVRPDSDLYIVNLNEITGDDQYQIPFVNGDSVYADTEAIFRVFGYHTEYQLNAEGTTVELLLQKQDGDPYETIRLQKEEKQKPEESKRQPEEQAVQQNPDIKRPGSTELPTVPQPENKKPMTEEEFLANGGVYPDDVQDVIDNRPEQPEPEPLRPQVIERPDKTPNRMPDEAFQDKWEDSKSTLAGVYQSGHASTGNVPYKERTEDFIAFNPMHKAIYYDTISVLYNTAEDVYVEATISSEWSDLALNTDHPESIAFYECIPTMVEATLKTILGEHEGGELFQYAKEHADKTVNGGYVGKHNERGDVIVEWTDGPVGDGIMSTQMDFEDWKGRETDDGLRYYAARSGEGIYIKVYKN